MGNSTPAHASGKDIVLHIFMGVVILLHGLERMDHHMLSGIIFISAGLVFLCCAIFHKKLIARFSFLDVVFHCIEALLAIVVSIEYIHEGKKAIPYFYLIAALFYFIAAAMQYTRSKKAKA